MKVLMIVPALDGGGIERIVFDYCSHMIGDVQFDIAVSADSEGILEAPIKELGCSVFHITQMRRNLFKHNSEIRDIISKGHYDIIHDNSGYKSFFNLMVAKRNGVKIRIAHSHSAGAPESLLSKIIRKVATRLTRVYATDLFACGQDAARWMWGTMIDVFIMTNAINMPAFSFDEFVRDKLRTELNLENKLVVGNVARFSFQKNHEFLIKVFKAITDIYDDAVLMLVGQGELMPEIKSMVENEQLTDKVLFLGVRDDVSQLYNAMDVFVLPSFYEGLPVSLVEVQANGLTAWVSDRITREIKISDGLHYLPIEDNEKEWAKCILDNKKAREHVDLSASEYDIQNASRKLIKKYTSMLERKAKA